jgi:hypothetical protein
VCVCVCVCSNAPPSMVKIASTQSLLRIPVDLESGNTYVAIVLYRNDPLAVSDQLLSAGVPLRI